MKKFFQSFLFFSIFLLLLVSSIAGTKIPQQSSAAVGPFQISKFKNGLSLYQNSRGKYYPLSPFNDYELLPDGARESFISYDEAQKNTFISDFKGGKVNAFTDSFLSYFGAFNPYITFQSEHAQIHYQSIIQGNHATIERKVIFNDNTSPRILGMTISFQGNDFVYDTRGSLYSYVSEDARNSFLNSTAITLTPSLDFLKIALPDKKVFILNPDISGVIGIRGRKNQIVRINRDAKLIEIEEVIKPNNGMYTSSFDIYTFDSPQEAIGSL